MLEKILPSNLLNILSRLNYKNLYEIRLRLDKPICILYANKIYYLTEDGLSEEITEETKISASKNLIESVILKASNYSIYSINDDIKKGFITLDSGIRIGLCGLVVADGNEIKTIKEFSSLNIRIPHEVKNCSLNVFNSLFEENEFQNTLVISSPCGGKTTFIRDLCYQISTKCRPMNILILDERNEISATSEGIPTMNIGQFSDIFLYGSKKMGFENGIRSMSPDLIVTDEIFNREDIESLQYAFNSGVKVLATVHSKNLEEFKEKNYFVDILRKKLFSRYVVLSRKDGIGTIEGVFDENLTRILWN